jgi:acyl-CoA reductase-like NAD-dependent aldehyde dehydrogenase
MSRHEQSRQDDLDDRLRRARQAHTAWKHLGFSERARRLRAFARRIRDDDEIVRIIQREAGKPEFEAFGFEVAYVCELTRVLTGRKARRALSESRRGSLIFPHKLARVTWQPRGVVAVIGPWNFPLLNNFGDAIAPLLAGNCVVLKPSPMTPETSRRVLQLWQSEGLPEGVLQLVEGGPEVGAALVDACDGVFFTGSVSIGMQIAGRAGARLIPCVTELGGKSAMLVLADADLQAAARAAVWGAFVGAGQACMRNERVLVEQSVADAFVAMVVEETRKLRVGLHGADVGPVMLDAQVERFRSLIANAMALGARLLTGGDLHGDPADRLFAPTVLDHVPAQAAMAREEIFGPVLPIVRVPDVDTAVRLANDSHLGLSGSVWSGDRRRAREIARRVQTGTLCVNDVLVNYFVVGAPLGGTKQSGLGFRHGVETLRQFCTPHTIVEDRALLEPIAQWLRRQLGFPYRDGVLRALRWLARAIYR